MISWIGLLLLLSGALLCLFAAVGVLRLPDFFMRMHAATKAGVAGSGLLLLGVAALDGTAATWVKAVLAVLFLLFTTPVAGHLIGRAGYLSGVPLWRGTREDALDGVLSRAATPADDAVSPAVTRVVLALAVGPNIDAAIAQAVALAQRHGVPLEGVAVIDVDRLRNVGPVPIGAGWHAEGMRTHRIAQARLATADVLQRFENAARGSGCTWSVRLCEGKPHKLLGALHGPGVLMTVAAGGWFDQGVLRMRVDLASRLEWPGKPRIRILQ